MPIKMHDIYWWLTVIYFIISILFMAHNTVLLIININNKYRRKMIILFSINMILSLILLFFIGNSSEWVGIRLREIATLSHLSDLQHQFKNKYGKYANTFDELGFNPDKLVSFRTTFYLMNGSTKSANFSELPSFVKVDNNHIYSITCIGMNKYGRNCDILSVDYNSNVELLESFNYWPLPEPKWHEWK